MVFDWQSAAVALLLVAACAYLIHCGWTAIKGHGGCGKSCQAGRGQSGGLRAKPIVPLEGMLKK